MLNFAKIFNQQEQFKNKKMKRLFYVLTTGILVGCSPKVTSEMMTKDFQPQPTNHVMIIGAADDIPAGTGAIGRVVVDGKGTSVRKQYGRMLNMAVKETAQKGGNVLVIDTVDTKKNSVKATMGYTNEAADLSLTLSPFRIDVLQKMTTIRRKPSAQPMDEVQQAGIAQQQDSVKQLEMEKWQVATQNMAAQKAVDDNNDNGDNGYNGGDVINAEPQKADDVFFKLSLGSAETVSEILVDNGYTLPKQRGFGASMTYGRFTNSKWLGWGLDFFYSHTNISETVRGYHYEGSYTLGYMGPSVMLKANFTDKFRLLFSLGMGVAFCNDQESRFGFGSKADLGLEFMVSDAIGIGIESMGFASSFKAPKNVKLKDGERYGYDQSAVMLSARYHF